MKERVVTKMADVKETLLTAEGLKKLEEELAYYKSVRRIEVAERIKTAIEYYGRHNYKRQIIRWFQSKSVGYRI